MRQITVLDVTAGTGGFITVRVAFWYAIVAAKAYPKNNFQSAIDPNLVTGGNVASGTTRQPVSQAEITSLQNGSVLEEVFPFTFPNSYSEATIEQHLLDLWTARNAAVQGQPNPIAFYGLAQDSVSGWGT